MGRSQKIITTVLWAALVLVMVGVVVGQFFLPKREPLPTKFAVEPFSLTDENGQKFSDRDLSGRPYVASMIFTNCGDICPMMTKRMSVLQGKTPADLQLVSFTVDPSRDTPAVLKKYGQLYKADEGRWHFLTGTEAQMTAVASGLKLSAKMATATEPILHSDYFLLIDGAGNCRGIYSGKSDADIERLAVDAKALLKAEPPHKASLTP